MTDAVHCNASEGTAAIVYLSLGMAALARIAGLPGPCSFWALVQSDSDVTVSCIECSMRRACCVCAGRLYSQAWAIATPFVWGSS